MAIYREGTKTSFGTKFVSDITNGPLNSTSNRLNVSLFLAVRVTDVVLNEYHPKFNEVGGWNGIGTIFYETIGLNEKSNGFAYPFDPHFKTLPLANEIVFLVSIPSKFGNDKDLIEASYYLNPIGIWNHPHHNASPKFENIDISINKEDQQSQDYAKSETGYVRRVEDNSTEINLNYLYYPNKSQSTFNEKTNIHPLLPFMGDTIFEGRFGNSIRLGNTTFSSDLKNNNWSSTGQNGDPITILRNGQSPSSSDSGWIPISEDIKKDLSSIYLTSYQKIPFSIANENFSSYIRNLSNQPKLPSQYTNPQIILNSDRIVINSKSDSTLISGEKSVYLSSNSTVNLESPHIVLSGIDIRLGSEAAIQSVLKGDDTITYLKILINELKNLTEALKLVQDWPGGSPVPNPTLLKVASLSQAIFEKIYNNIDSVKSNFVKII